MQLNPRTKKTLLRWLKQRDKIEWANIYSKEMTKTAEGLDEEQFNRVVNKSINDIGCKTISSFRALLKHYKNKQTSLE